MYHPNKEAMYKVRKRNIKWKGRNGWVVICEKEEGDDSDDKPIALELVCKMVTSSANKNEGVSIENASES